jgi:hypothetical protein
MGLRSTCFKGSSVAMEVFFDSTITIKSLLHEARMHLISIANPELFLMGYERFVFV